MERLELDALDTRFRLDMTGLVFESQGTLDNYIGDAVMAFWAHHLKWATTPFMAATPR